MSKNNGGDAASSVPVPASPDRIRNVLLVGPSGAGKSGVLAQIMSLGSGGPAGSPGGGARAERRHAGKDEDRSTGLTVATVEYDGLAVTVVDTPGHPDLVGELRAGARAADAAIFVISAVDEIDGATRLLWQECASIDVPRLVVITKLDLPEADFGRTVEACRRAFGDVQPVWAPDGAVGADGFALIDLLATGDPTLVEAIIEESEDETLLDRYLGGEPVDQDALVGDLRTAVAQARIFPVVPVDFVSGAGVEQLMGVVARAFPSPEDGRMPSAYTPAGVMAAPLTADPAGPLVAEVVRTTTDAFVGRTSLMRLFSGTLREGDSVHVSGHLGQFVGRELEGHADHDDDERIGPLSVPSGDTSRPVKEAIAGQVVLVTKLSRAETSDTLSSPEHPLVVAPWVLPEPLLPVAVHAATTSDEDKLAAALQRIAAEDVTLRLEHNADQQVVLWTMGQAHVDGVLHRLRDGFGVAVDVVPLRLSLRETFLRPTTVQGRHVKQSGGHGQYAVCTLQVEPLERGAGIEFVDKVVGGAVPRQFIASVEKGVRAQLDKGVLAGYPVVDVRVTLTDGKAHSVDSSDMAFQTAATLALRQAANEQTVALLEPVDSVAITVGDEHVGAVMSDLRGRRAHVQSTAPAEQDGWTVVHAEVPQSELARYPIDLRSLSHGTGSFTRQPLRFDYLPAALAKELFTGLG